jgi:HSP20 family protein
MNMKRKPAAGDEEAPSLRTVERVMIVDISDEMAYRPPSDVHETSEEVIIRMELPGVPREGIDVRVRGCQIEVAGEKRPDLPAPEASYLCLERGFGRFHRAFDVHGSVNLARLKAVLKGGVLILVLPKIPERRGRERRIPIAADE